MKLCICLIPLMAFAADSDNLAARRLYYEDNAPEVVFKATTVAQQKPKPVEAPKPKQVVAQQPVQTATRTQQLDQIQKALREAATTALNADGAKLKPASNLGVRYNILKVDAATNTRTEVSPDTVFHEKDCVAVRIQPNRGGYLYVFNEASSGKWQALIPSPETADDSNVVRAYNLMDVPASYCFEMDEKPGTERLLIVVTDKPTDIMKLNDTLKTGAGKSDDGGPHRSDSYVVADSDLKPFMTGLQGRDLKITKVGAKPAAGEAPYSTYLVNAAATTGDRLVLEIKLKHQK